MESTKLIQAIERLRRTYERPPSHVEVVRDAVLKQINQIDKPEMPVILNESQRKVFMNKIDLLEGFLESEDGADAVEMLINAFEHYCERVEAGED